MAITKIEDVETEFGKRLFNLGKAKGLLGPAQIADALYNNLDCYKIIQPGGRKERYRLNLSKDMTTIAKAVQRHFSADNYYDVPSPYMYAYHLLFNCSMDYLYGIIDEPSPDAETNDISKKTGLSTKAIANLTSGEEVCMEEYLVDVDNYGLFDWVGMNAENADDEYLDTYQPMIKFWNAVLESDLYKSLPEAWYRMACSLYTSKAIKLVAEDARKNMNTLPTWESFESFIDEWNVFHPDERLDPPTGMTLKEFYDQEPGRAMQFYREARHAHYYSADEKEENYETVYWGCAGKFDRMVLDFFHRESEKWCHTGPLPNFFD